MYGANDQRHNYYKVEYSCVYGDIDLNGMINIFDIIILVQCVLIDNCDMCADINLDGQNNILDVIELINLIFCM